MLQSLHVKNLALIDEAEVDFSNGLNILSGETGAGKSIIIGSISLALGGKVQKEMLREASDGEETEPAFVELVFTVEDDGPGVPPERVAELFPGGEGGRLPDWRQAGNGIAIAQRIARLHGGALVAGCAPGRGLRVSASIPLGVGRGDGLACPGPGFDEGGFDSALVGLSHLLPAEVFRPEDYE